MKRCIALLLAALTLLTVSGCASWNEEDYLNDPLSELSRYYQTDTPEEPAALTDFALPYLSGETLDPVTCGDGVQHTLSALLYEPLYRLTPQFETEPVLAQSESYDPQTFTYTITLRAAKFSDGTPLTAQDAAATLNRARLSTRYGARLADVTAIRAEDSSTLTLRLSRDRRGFTALLDIPIVKEGTETNAFPTGSGPYAKSPSEDQLIQNTCWHRPVTLLPFQRILLLPYKSQDAAAYAFSSHDVHLLAYDMTGSKGDVASTSGSYTDADTTILQYLAFNTNRRLFQDADMRTAISMVVDRATYVSAYLMGHGVETQFPIHPASSLYPKSLETAYTAEDCAAAMAEQYMADGEWIYSMTLLVNSENTFRVSIAQEIAKELERYDFKVTVNALPWEQYLSALQEGRYDLYFAECKLTADWDVSALVGTGGSLNYGGFSDSIVDSQLSACLSADESSRADAVEALCRRLQSQMPIIPLCFKRTSVLLPYDAVDAITPTAADPFYHLENWHVNWGTANDTETKQK